MPVCNIGTAEKLFEAINKALNEKNIPWCNVIGFESDTTNVMMGKHNSVLSRIKQKQPDVFSQGCVCHLSNLCLLAGVKLLPIDVNDFFVDFFIILINLPSGKRSCMNFKSSLELKS